MRRVQTHAISPASYQPVSVVIVTWNSAAEIEKCLSPLLTENPQEVVVIDNGSSDNTCDLVRGICPQAKIIKLETNRGFSVACNVGVAVSHAPYILFLNADAYVEPNYLAKLIETIEKVPDAASIVGKLVYEDNQRRFIDSAGIQLCAYALRPLDRGHGQIDEGQFNTVEEIFGPSGAAALYRRAALMALGDEIFDEDFFAYYEDVDLAWRLKKMGWKHLYQPAATAWHHRRGPQRKPGPIASRAFGNRYLLWLKNESLWRFVMYAPVALSWEAARVVRRLFTEPQLLRGIPHAVGVAPKIWRKRLQAAERNHL